MRRRRVLNEGARPDSAGDEATFVEIDPDQLRGVFAVPSWLRDLGVMSWLLVGVAAAARRRGLAARRSPRRSSSRSSRRRSSPRSSRRSCGWLARHRLGRGGGAAVVLLARGRARRGLIVVLLLAGVTSQAPELQKSLHGAVDKSQGWLQDAGVSAEQGAERGRRRELVGQRRVPRAARRRRHRRQGARLARGLPLLHRAEPVLPAQGRPGDPRAGPSATWASRTTLGRIDHGPDAAVAARLLRRRHGGRRVQRGRHRPGRAGPRRARTSARSPSSTSSPPTSRISARGRPARSPS